jgi:hypothetical protein
MSYTITTNNDRIVVDVTNPKYEVSLARTGGQGSKGDSVSNVFINSQGELVFTISTVAGTSYDVNLGDVVTIFEDSIRQILVSDVVNGNKTFVDITYDTNTNKVNFVVQTDINDTPNTIVERDSTGKVRATGVHFLDGISNEGLMEWNTTDGTLDLHLKGDNVVLQVGQEQVVRVWNNTGATINNGQVVYVDGAHNGLTSVKLANASSEATSSKTFGIATETILADSYGYVTTFGLVRGLDTSGYTAGQRIYLDIVSGRFTTTQNTTPYHLVHVGWISTVDTTIGSVFVNIDNGYELNELHDVKITNVANGHVLKYDAALGYWVNTNLDLEYATDAQLVAGLATKSDVGHTHAINDLSDVNVSVAATGYVIGYNSVYNRWESRKLKVSELNDVNYSGIKNNDVLRYDLATQVWKPHTLTTTSMTDVDNTNKVNGAVLVYNGSTAKYTATTTLNDQIINGGSF